MTEKRECVDPRRIIACGCTYNYGVRCLAPKHQYEYCGMISQNRTYRGD